MNIVHQILVFGSSPQSISVGPAKVYRLRIEPLSSNLHDAFIIASDVGTGASGNTDGVIKRLARSPDADSNAITDAFDFGIEKGSDPVDTSQFRFSGTAGEGVRVALYIF